MSIARTERVKNMILQGLQMPIEEALRIALDKAIAEGRSLYQIASEAGVDYASLHRFANKTRLDIRISTAEKLLAYFELKIVPNGNAAKKSATKKPPKK
jgi:hypothetical protein